MKYRLNNFFAAKNYAANATEVIDLNMSDVISNIKISFPKAALGTEVEIETVEGNVTLKVPAGTQSGKVFRLSGRGITQLHSSRRGDHLVKVLVETPSKLTSKQKKLLEEFENEKHWF